MKKSAIKLLHQEDTTWDKVYEDIKYNLMNLEEDQKCCANEDFSNCLDNSVSKSGV